MTPPGGASVAGAMWYKTILQSTACPNDGSTLYPNSFGQSADVLTWALVLPPSTAAAGWSAVAYSDNQPIGQWRLGEGLHYSAAARPARWFAAIGAPRCRRRSAQGCARCPLRVADLIYNYEPPGRRPERS